MATYQPDPFLSRHVAGSPVPFVDDKGWFNFRLRTGDIPLGLAYRHFTLLFHFIAVQNNLIPQFELNDINYLSPLRRNFQFLWWGFSLRATRVSSDLLTHTCAHARLLSIFLVDVEDLQVGDPIRDYEWRRGEVIGSAQWLSRSIGVWYERSCAQVISPTCERVTGMQDQCGVSLNPQVHSLLTSFVSSGHTCSSRKRTQPSRLTPPQRVSHLPCEREHNHAWWVVKGMKCYMITNIFCHLSGTLGKALMLMMSPFPGMFQFQSIG